MKGLCIASAMLLASSVSATATPRSDIVSLIERAASSSAVDVVSFDRYPEGRGIATTFMFVEDDIRYTFLYDAGFSLGTHGLVINIGPAVYQPGHFPEEIGDPEVDGKPNLISRADGSVTTCEPGCDLHEAAGREAEILALLRDRTR